MSNHRLQIQQIMGPPTVPKKKPIKRTARKSFLFWDGEGRTINGEHKYVLLANSDGYYIEDENGLSTRQCVDFLIEHGGHTKNRDNIWYGMGYDVCKILNDVPLRGKFKYDVQSLERLWNHGEAFHKGWKIGYVPRKIFKYSRAANERFYSTDIFAFFQGSFEYACRKWKIDSSEISEGKANRSVFNTWTLKEIRDYNFKELKLGLELAEKLYLALKEVDLLPRSWYGPGSVVNRYFKKNKFKDHYGKLPTEMEIPIRTAYFGGRIDNAYIGEVGVFQYDIMSAYPRGLADCISLKDNKWWYNNSHLSVTDKHALYHIKWDIPYAFKWGPFPWRDHQGRILYPNKGEGWYWGVEVIAAEKRFGKKYIKRIEMWFPSTHKKPFEKCINETFEQRSKVGTQTGEGIVLKLVLNSLYGKLCQSVGKAEWQNFVWAGYITAYTRAKLLDAMRLIGEANVVSVATDGLFTTRAFDREQSRGLGNWELIGYFKMLLVAAGLYTLIGKDGKISVSKQRGLPTNINHGWVLRSWGCTTKLDGKGEDTNESKFSNFIGIGKALHQNKPFGTWQDESRILHNVREGGTSKRLPPAILWNEESWLLLALGVRQRDRDEISMPYKRNDLIQLEKKIEDEVSEETT